MHTIHTLLSEIVLVNKNMTRHICIVPKIIHGKELRVPLSFRIPLQQLQEIEDAVRKETRKHRTDLVEFVWNWAWNEYKKSGSLQALLSGTRTGRYSRRVSEELQDQLYTALATILDRAPSTVIEDVAHTLTARAGKYGTPK
jgi:hypothetical protein